MSEVEEIGPLRATFTEETERKESSLRTQIEQGEDSSAEHASILQDGTTSTKRILTVALLTGGGDRPYVYGLAKELLLRGIQVDLIGSDDLDFSDLRQSRNLNFLNLRGSSLSNVSLMSKTVRIARYYIRLFLYAATTRKRIFHILWNNKLQTIDRTLVMAYYKLLGKQVTLTVHNVNAARRDGQDSALNRLTLRIQYSLSDVLFVHTDKMRYELEREFDVPSTKIITIPFGINNAVPVSKLTCVAARKQLQIPADAKTILFFGNIKPYKGVDLLLDAYRVLMETSNSYHLLIAGRPDNCEAYWKQIQSMADMGVQRGRIQIQAGFIPDEEVERYFKAADVLVLPYRHIYQSGVLFLAHSFGLPVVATRVGSLAEEIVEGENGLVCDPDNPEGLANCLQEYFESSLFHNLADLRSAIARDAGLRHSWEIVGERTVSVYSHLGGFMDATRTVTTI